MGKSKGKNPKTPTEKVQLSPAEEQYRLMYDFAYYLENMPRGPVGGATQLLRQFLSEKGLYEKDTNTG